MAAYGGKTTAWKNDTFDIESATKTSLSEPSIAAQALSRKDALEVFYIAVVLGFRGFYADADSAYRAELIQAMRLPNSIEAWCKEIARSLQLRQGRPQIIDKIQAGGSARPLSGRSSLAAFALLSSVLLAAAISCFILLFVKGSQ